jgi:hypothetical protein
MISKYLLGVLFFMLFVGNAFAQVDAHYWTHQYGARGLLLNGAVIASTDDETAIYYNPGAMGLNENLGLSFSFFTPTYNFIETDNFLGENTSFSDQGLDLSPGFLSVNFSPFENNRLVFGVTTFTRFKTDLEFKDRIIDKVNSVVDLLFLGDLEFQRKVKESWYGLGFSYRLADNFSLGVTQFGVWHNQDVKLEYRKEIFSEHLPERLLSGWRSDFSYGFSANAGFLTKLGLAWAPGDVRIGMTYTSPVYAFIQSHARYDFDDQKVYRQDSIVSQSNLRDMIGLENYRTPWSVGLGFDFSWNSYRISMSSEYFSEVKDYAIIDDSDDPFDGMAISDNPINISVISAKESVLNFAVGVQKTMNEKTTWVWGFRTDFNPNATLSLNEGIDFLSSSPNVYHASAGGIFLFGDNQVSFGIDYGIGIKSGGRQLIDLSDINNDNLFTYSSNNTVKTTTHSFMVFLTYDFLFDRWAKDDD